MRRLPGRFGGLCQCAGFALKLTDVRLAMRKFGVRQCVPAMTRGRNYVGFPM